VSVPVAPPRAASRAACRSPRACRPLGATALLSLLALAHPGAAQDAARATDAPATPVTAPANDALPVAPRGAPPRDATPTAPSLRPLADFLAAARTHAVDNREARALAAQSGARHRRAIATLLPSLNASAGYTRNQLEIAASFPDGAGGTAQAVITARDQLEATLGVEATLFDYGALRALGGTAAGVDAADAEIEASEARTDRAVIEAFFQYTGGEALCDAARQAESTSARSAAVVAARRDAGLASELDVARAQAAVARAAQALSDAELAARRAARVLHTLSGLAVTGAAPPLGDALDEEGPLAPFVADVDRLPAVRAARAQLRSAEASAGAAWGALLPRITANFRERITNAPGFGPNALWSAGLAASWRLDAGDVAALREGAAAAEVARIRADRADELARDAIEDAWQVVHARLAQARAARSERDTAARAAEVARTRYAAGTATALEVVEAERDAFAADVSRVRADTELAYARAALRLAAGQAPRVDATRDNAATGDAP
jgi:outer membrane protein TolC